LIGIGHSPGIVMVDSPGASRDRSLSDGRAR